MQLLHAFAREFHIFKTQLGHPQAGRLLGSRMPACCVKQPPVSGPCDCCWSYCCWRRRDTYLATPKPTASAYFTTSCSPLLPSSPIPGMLALLSSKCFCCSIACFRYGPQRAAIRSNRSDSEPGVFLYTRLTRLLEVYTVLKRWELVSYSKCLRFMGPLRTLGTRTTSRVKSLAFTINAAFPRSHQSRERAFAKLLGVASATDSITSGVET